MEQVCCGSMQQGKHSSMLKFSRLTAEAACLSSLLGLAGCAGVRLIPTMHEWISKITQMATGMENTTITTMVLMLKELSLLLVLSVFWQLLGTVTAQYFLQHAYLQASPLPWLQLQLFTVELSSLRHSVQPEPSLAVQQAQCTLGSRASPQSSSSSREQPFLSCREAGGDSSGEWLADLVVGPFEARTAISSLGWQCYIMIEARASKPYVSQQAVSLPHASQQAVTASRQPAPRRRRALLPFCCLISIYIY